MTGNAEFSSRYHTMVSQARDKFWARLGSDVEAMNDDLETSSEKTGEAVSEALDRLHHRLHEITGTAGMLGLNELHSGGREALNLVEHAVDGNRPLDQGESNAVSAYLSELSSQTQNLMADK